MGLPPVSHSVALVSIIIGLSVSVISAQPPASRMAAAANAFLATLDPTQVSSARFPFDSEERFNWHFVPRPRAGVPLKQLKPKQQEAALDLLRAGLGDKGYTKAETIRALEPVLAEMEKNPTRRDPELYYVTIFGEPTDTGTWGWRWEGHHLSQNWTIVNGTSVATSPQFFGANPAEVRAGPKKGTRALHAEEDLGRAVVQALSEAQRSEAIVSRTAPDDILTSNTRKAAIQENRGLPYRSMTTEQRGLLLTLIEEYAGNLPESLARDRMDRLRKAGVDAIVFAWMGGVEKGQPHYYRVQGPTFLIEYDNTQNDANHIHSVWRDFAGDWGEDLLAQHYRNAAHHQKR